LNAEAEGLAEPRGKLDAIALNGPEDDLDWDAIYWPAHEQNVARLRRRIFKATRERDWAQVRSLQKMLLRSWSNTQVASARSPSAIPGAGRPGSTETSLSPHRPGRRRRCGCTGRCSTTASSLTSSTQSRADPPSQSTGNQAELQLRSPFRRATPSLWRWRAPSSRGSSCRGRLGARGLRSSGYTLQNPVISSSRKAGLAVRLGWRSSSASGFA
jgi:hypothetical protein